MAGRRAIYLCSLAGAAAFYLASGEWFSYLLLAALALLPWLSLALSLPAMLVFRLQLEGAEYAAQGEDAQIWLAGICALPMPPFRGRIWLRSCQTGERIRYWEGEALPTEHCGGWIATAQKARVFDYLGLFAFPARCRGERLVLVRPRSVPVLGALHLDSASPRIWRAKSGGGYGENHELRPYRPGDGLNQVHWKLSAKVGSLTVRETMEPVRERALVRLAVTGSPEEVDRTLGRLRWLGEKLLSQDVPFEIRALAADGVQCLPVAGERTLKQAIDELLKAGLADTNTAWEPGDFAAPWVYDIGGEPDAEGKSDEKG